jgi:CRP/FNR family transcriptional regulator
MIQEFKASYRPLFEHALIQNIFQVGTYKEVPKGFKLMDIGRYLKGMSLLTYSAIIVLQEDKMVIN